MRYFVGLVLVLALGVTGCSETSGAGGSAGDGGSGGDGGAAGMGGGGGEAGTGGERMSLVFLIASFEPPLPGPPREGVRVCVLDTDNCAVTNGTGNATLEVIAEQETAYAMEEGGLARYIYTHVPRVGVPLGVGNSTEARMDENFGLVNSPYPMQGTGAIWVSGSPEGATLALLNGTGKPFYAEDNERQSWNPDLTAATSHGGGGFVEVAPGDYQVEVSGTSESCIPARGWPGDSENTVRMPVREGYLSSARVECD